jgi:predicted nucleic acid-binding protein
VLDSGAISALADGDVRARAIVAERRRRGAAVLTSAVVVAETTGQGQRDAPTNRVLAGIELVDVGEPIARFAGVLRHRSGVSGTVDALVVATAAAEAAVEGGAVVLTADIDDIGRLADGAAGVKVQRW